MPANLPWLAKELREILQDPMWKGIRYPDDKIDGLLDKGPFIAEFHECGDKTSHEVIVDSLSESGNLKIRDPWEGTKYEMTLDEFYNYWTGNACFKELK